MEIIDLGINYCPVCGIEKVQDNIEVVTHEVTKPFSGTFVVAQFSCTNCEMKGYVTFDS